MLTWAQHIASAAHGESSNSSTSHSQLQGSPSDPPADSGKTDGQAGQPSMSSPAMQQVASTSAADGDPVAFNASPFGTGESVDKQQGHGIKPSQPEQAAAAASSQADPFAFDMGAFGIPAEPDSPPAADTHAPASMHEADKPPAATQQVRAPSNDPYAFDMGAFGMGGLSAASDNDTAHVSAPAEAKQEESSTVLEAQDPGALIPAAAADPYAFDMGAFGMAVEAPGDAADSSMTARADPYAFDMGAFGMAVEILEPAHDSSVTSPPSEAQNASSAAEDTQAPSISAAPADAFAFDMGAFGMAMSDTADTAAERSVSSGAAQESQQQRYTSPSQGQQSQNSYRVLAPAQASLLQSTKSELQQQQQHQGESHHLDLVCQCILHFIACH